MTIVVRHFSCMAQGKYVVNEFGRQFENYQSVNLEKKEATSMF